MAPSPAAAAGTKRKRTEKSDDTTWTVKPDEPCELTLDRSAHHSISNIFKSGTYSDCEIVLKGGVFKGHVVILASACSYFDRAFFGSFRVRRPFGLRLKLPWLTWGQEGAERRVDLSGEDPSLVMALLKYIYGHKLEHVVGQESSALVFAAKICVIADKFGYKPLYEAAKSHLRDKSKICLDHDALRALLVQLSTMPVSGDVTTFREIGQTYMLSSLSKVKDFTRAQHESLGTVVPYYTLDLLSLLVQPAKMTRWKCSHCSTSIETESGYDPKTCTHCRSTLVKQDKTVSDTKTCQYSNLRFTQHCKGGYYCPGCGERGF